MKLLLIRHGETVDNVAQLYAGTRDSDLTNHGVLQATKLGQQFQDSGLRIKHLFSSPLRRTAKTAKLIQHAQNDSLHRKCGRVAETSGSGFITGDDAVELEIVYCPALIEQDFGFYEGKPFYQRPHGGNLTGKQAHQKEHENSPGFVGPESKESMTKRADSFLDEHLLPLFRNGEAGSECVVAVVSHGILLSNLWRCLLRRVPGKSVTLSPELLASMSPVDLEHLGGWSNTGYLELDIDKTPSVSPNDATPQIVSVSTEISSSESCSAQENVSSEPESATVVDDAVFGNIADLIKDNNTKDENDLLMKHTTLGQISRTDSTPQRGRMMLDGWQTKIKTINGKSHLKGIKRTGGGVGSAKFEEGQKTIESFFKRRKLG